MGRKHDNSTAAKNADRPKRPAVSVKGTTYSRLQKEAKRRGISVPALVEEIITNSWEQQEVAKR